MVHDPAAPPPPPPPPEGESYRPLPPDPAPPAAPTAPAAAAATPPGPAPATPPGPTPATPPGVDAAKPPSRHGALGLIALVAMVVAVSVEEDGENGWGRIGVWAGAAVAAALATLVPAVRSSLNLDERRAWAVAIAGGVFLAGFWVLFVLPVIQMNVSFVATLACAAGVGAAWIAPGGPTPPEDDRR